ncbi:ROK family transcriptional regulator [Pseudothermotoga sp.]|uniref:ROK family transcriptional regulator n=1 Tax=Pseudothermotoga sp. TaxID=2033661 RepID=UPI00258630AB|nr:ROK family transcriptional regulator [Pseudothermotoga sp.]MDK2885375.1 hypothetical protein [Pseudothermotoga sp.]
MIQKNSEREILRILRRSGHISRSKLSLQTGLSKPAVSEIVSGLISLGVIREVKKGKSSSKGGKRPILLEFKPDYRYIIAIDVGGTKLRVALTDLESRVIETRVVSSKGVTRKDDLLNLICKNISPFLEEREKILGIGIGVPGTVDMKNGFVYYMPAFNLRNIELKSMVQKEVDLPTLVANDVNLNALGEMWKGAARGHKNVLLISLGTGTGAGIILDRHMCNGSRGMAGEIGYMITDWSREKYNDFPFGNLEKWFSGYALEKKLKEIGENMSLKDFFERTASSEDLNNILNEACEHLALAMVNAICLLDPEVVVITGGIGFNQYDKIIEKIMPVFEKTVPAEIFQSISFKKSELGDMGVIVGANYLVQKEFFVVD